MLGLLCEPLLFSLLSMRTCGLLFTVHERPCEDAWAKLSDVFSAGAPTGVFDIT